MAPVQLVHLDSRHTEAAVVLAREANQRKVFVSLDVEKNRVFLADLLPLCDIFFTNKEFSEVYFKNRMKDIHNVRLERNRGSISDSSEESSAEFLNSLLAMSFLFYTDPAVQGVTSSERSRAEFAVTTRGSLGSLLMRRKGDRTTRNRTEEVEEQATANSDFISENLLENAPIQIDEFLFTRRNSDSSPDEVFEIIR